MTDGSIYAIVHVLPSGGRRYNGECSHSLPECIPTGTSEGGCLYSLGRNDISKIDIHYIFIKVHLFQAQQ